MDQLQHTTLHIYSRHGRIAGSYLGSYRVPVPYRYFLDTGTVHAKTAILGLVLSLPSLRNRGFIDFFFKNHHVSLINSEIQVFVADSNPKDNRYRFDFFFLDRMQNKIIRTRADIHLKIKMSCKI
jgi:hypothetical protein